MGLTKDPVRVHTYSIYLNADDFLKGQAISPYMGNASVSNMEVFDIPGILKPQYATTPLYTLNQAGVPLCSVNDQYGNNYVGTDVVPSGTTSNLFVNGVLLSNLSGPIYDMKIAYDYLFLSVGSNLAVYGPLGATTKFFFPTWQSGLATGYYKPIVVTSANSNAANIYVGNGNNISRVTNFTPNANPAIAPASTWDLIAQGLPYGESVRSMCEYSNMLAIGTQKGSGFFDFGYGVGNIYFWDKNAVGLVQPQRLGESGVHQLYTVGNILYAHAGVHGNVYQTNTVSSQLYQIINFNDFDTSTTLPYPNAINKVGNEILIGTSTGTDSFPGSMSQHGVYSFLGKSQVFRNQISTNNIGTSQSLKIGFIQSFDSGVNKNIYIGWQDGLQSGVDQLSSNVYNNYQSSFESQLYKVGTRLAGHEFRTLEITTARPLITGQRIRVSFRNALNGTYQVISTFDVVNNLTTTSNGQVTQYIDKVGIPKCQLLQLKIEMAQDNTVLFGNVPELMELILT